MRAGSPLRPRRVAVAGMVLLVVVLVALEGPRAVAQSGLNGRATPAEPAVG